MAVGQRAPYIHYLLSQSPGQTMHITALNAALLMGKIHPVTFADLIWMGFCVNHAYVTIKKNP